MAGAAALLTPLEALGIAEQWPTVARLGDSDLPMLAVDLRHADRSLCTDNRDRRLTDALLAGPWVNLAVVGPGLDVTLEPLADAFDVLLGDASGSNAVVDVDDVETSVVELGEAVAASPDAAVALAQLLRLTHAAPVESALYGESITYGLLQTGPRYRSWLEARSRSAPQPTTDPPVLVERAGSHLTITLNRPDRRNALDVAMRDAWFEALELLEADPSLDGALLRGAGANFCAGGDLDEFGTTPSPAAGHHVRTVRSLGRLMHRVRGRLRVHVHGACVGAGIELPAFAGTVVASADATFRLPEIGFGLVPGAGGTVSITRRCGRHRTAWLALTGSAIDARTALDWQLVDRVDPT